MYSQFFYLDCRLVCQQPFPCLPHRTEGSSSFGHAMSCSSPTQILRLKSSTNPHHCHLHHLYTITSQSLITTSSTTKPQTPTRSSSELETRLHAVLLKLLSSYSSYPSSGNSILTPRPEFLNSVTWGRNSRSIFLILDGTRTFPFPTNNRDSHTSDSRYPTSISTNPWFKYPDQQRYFLKHRVRLQSGNTNVSSPYSTSYAYIWI